MTMSQKSYNRFNVLCCEDATTDNTPKKNPKKNQKKNPNGLYQPKSRNPFVLTDYKTMLGVAKWADVED